MAKWLHWIIFFLFSLEYVIAIFMYGMSTNESTPKELYMVHKSIGVTLFFLALFRLVWRNAVPLPAWPDSITDFEKKAFHVIEYGLYVLMILMPVSGYVYSLAGGYGFKFFGLFQFPDLIGKQATLSEIGKYLHRIAAFFILAFVASHVSLILRHHYDEKGRFIDRMSLLSPNKKASS